jgi:tetratricopeptide (TPR) repeat protein
MGRNRRTRVGAARLWALVLALGSLAAQSPEGSMLSLRPEGSSPAKIRQAVRTSGGKLGFLYFTTDWCGWCKKLQKDTFTDKEFVGFTETHFLPYLVNAEKSTGPELRNLYKVNAYPTVVIVDEEGRMVDMVIGYKLPEPYLAELRRIVEGRDTLAGLQAAYAENPDDAATGLRLADKHFRANAHESARVLYEKVRPAVREGKARAGLTLNLAAIYSFGGERDKAAGLLEEGLEEGVFEDDRDRVFNQLGSLRFQKGDMAGALAMFRRVPEASRFAQTAQTHIVIALSKLGERDEARRSLDRLWATWGGDDNRLYTILWYLQENEVFLEQALEWSRRTVERTDWSRPHAINQYAGLLLDNGKKTEALEAGRKAIEAAEAKSKPLYGAYLAALEFRSGDPQAAERTLKGIDDGAVTEASTFNNMAWICLEHGFGLEKGLVWAEKAVRLSQFLDDNILSTYAGLLHQSGRTAEAIEALEKAMAITTYEYRRKDYAATIEKYRDRI